MAAIPPTVTSAAETSGKATVKNTVLVGMGYASSSLLPFQFVPSYKGALNYNLNKDARASQFMSNVASLYVTRAPLARFSYGLKLEGSVNFKNDVAPATQTVTYRTYSRGASFGPYFRFEAARRLLFSLELTIDPIHYDQDSTDSTSDLKRSGTGKDLRVSVQNDQGARLFNLTASIHLASSGASGREYDSNEIGFSFSNLLRLSDKLEISPGLNYAQSNYSKRQLGTRRDRLLDLQAIGTYKLLPKWTILGNLDYASNASNVEETYSYNRFAMGTGLTYSF